MTVLRFYFTTADVQDYNDVTVNIRTGRAFVANRDTRVTSSGPSATVTEATLKTQIKDALTKRGITWTSEI